MPSTDHAHRLTSAYWPADRSEPVLDQTIGEALREAASRYGSRTALIDGTPEQGRRQWSFETAASRIIGVASEGCRKPEIMADAAHAILTRDSAACTKLPTRPADGLEC